MTSDSILPAWVLVLKSMDEIQRRRTAGLKAIELGRGGISRVRRSCGLSRDTIRKGIMEIKSGKLEKPTRLRKEGAGRKKIFEKYPNIKKNFEEILDEITAGDPMSSLKWTHKSTYAITEVLKKKGYLISEDTVGRILKSEGYTLQANDKSHEGNSRPERDEQFRYINEQCKKFTNKNQPIISVDTKKKELIGNFRNAGRTWRKKGQPEEVNVYDFPDLASGKAVPYGTYDVALNKGFVNVGISSDTAEFAVESIRQWWKQLGKRHYPKTKELLLTADCGGSNSNRSDGWKFFLHKLAKETKLTITVLHFPPATSKWNKIEHRMFSFISMNWKGKPLINYQVIINFIKNTTTKTGLEIFARLDKNKYTKGRKFLDKEMNQIKIINHSLHPEWNYTIYPKTIK